MTYMMNVNTRVLTRLMQNEVNKKIGPVACEQCARRLSYFYKFMIRAEGVEF